MTDPANMIAFQGAPGANSDIACRTVYPDMTTLPCRTFVDAFDAVEESKAELAMIPIDNSVAGRVADIHHLLPESGLFIIGEHFERINHQLVAVKGTDIAEILRNVSAGKFDRPRMVDSSIPKPLEAVCLKAMSLKPEDRYETPLELANDIEAWLADSPVSAWEEPLSVRTNRWVKNNKTLVVGAAATIVVALISSLIASAFLSSKNQELIKANTVATKKRKSPTNRANSRSKQ